MPGSPNTSFIPKHSSSKTERRSTPRQLFFGTILVRVLFVAVLVAAAGVYFYERKLAGDLNEAVTKFNSEASFFESDEAKLQEVLSFDKRLKQAQILLDGGVSVLSLLEAIENSTIETVQFTNLDYTRESPEEDSISIAANIRTNSFDSTLFQRKVFYESSVLGRAQIEDVTIVNVPEERAGQEELSGIEFSAVIKIDPKDIIYTPNQAASFISAPGVPSPEPVPVVEPDPNVEVGFDNQDTLWLATLY